MLKNLVLQTDIDNCNCGESSDMDYEVNFTRQIVTN